MEVSNYCDQEYLKNRSDPVKSKQCLNQTKQYTTQSLASVAYQINTLATTFLQILEMQTAQLNQLETSINKVSQKVDLYQEKVARRDIGKLANPKPQIMQQPLIFFDKRNVKGRYIRKGIDFNQLDALGSGGIRSRMVQQNQNQNLGRLQNNYGRAMSTTSSGSGSRDIQSHYSTKIFIKKRNFI